MKSKVKSILVAMLALCAFSMNAETDLKTPKNEFRSTWISTVWGLDWPTNVGYTSAHATRQKQQMTKILDSLAVNNFNAVCFQVRGMSDAMYKSSYEPWSEFLTGTRGKEPTWDPLAFVVEECHKRGMECHAWVNPYRFNTSSSKTGAGDVTGYYEKGWLIKNPSGYSILNPSKEEVQDHIVKICKEITQNYDIDGMLFDDYYYNNAALDKDKADYDAYKAAGGTLGQEDWRRANVHNLMSKLYKMFQEVNKPWIRFGQAPPGGTFTTKALADKYGIEPCPSGTENCYNSQYIDIMGWLQAGIIDYISPQVYWAIGYNTADYGKMVPWWGTVANKFGRHLFVSQSISDVASYDGAGMVTLSGEIKRVPTMTGNGSTSNIGEVEDQVALNRTSSLNGAFGSIFFSSKHLDGSNGPNIGHYLKRSLYSMPSLPPAMSWKTTTNPGKVSGLTYDGTKLSWTAMADDKNKRYTVYAIPNGLEVANFAKDVKYLLDFTYSNEFELPEEYRMGYYYAVCVYDRFGNEWDAAIYQSTATSSLGAPTISSPANNTTYDKTFDFKWNAVSGATKYAVEVAAESTFTDILASAQTETTSLSSDVIYSKIDKNKTLYWRVRALASGKKDGVSEVRTFVYSMPELTAPIAGATGLDPKVNFTWNVTTAGATVTIEVASDSKFADVVFTEESTTGNYQTPMCTLKQQTTYYARLSYNGHYSKVVAFSTKAIAGAVPVIKYPTNGGTLWANNSLLIEPQEGAEQVEVMIDSTTDFAGSTRCRKVLTDFVFSIPAADILMGTKKTAMVDGTTYYVKARVKYYDETGTIVNTDYCDVISFVYSSKSSAIDNVAVAAGVKLAGNKVVINADKETSIKVSAVSMLGSEEQLYAGQGSNEEVSLEGLSSGMYIIKVVLDNEVRTIKYVK